MNLLRNWFCRIGARFVGGTIIATILVAFYYTLAPNPNAEFARLLFLNALIYATTIGVISHLFFSNFHAFYKRLPPLRRYPAVALTLATLGAIGSALGTAVLFLLGFVPRESLNSQAIFSLKISVLGGLVFGFAFFTFYEFRHRLEATTLALRTRELEKERAEKLAGEARLASLESRIHPHFLFNALNSVSALIQEDPERAERQIERISRVLRFALDRATLTTVPVWEEMKIVADYLEIEHTRFGDRLRYWIYVSKSAETQQIPPLSVQSLVENSLKYAVAPRREGGEVRVTAKCEGDLLSVEVWDNGPGFTPDSRPAGHGLHLLESRLTAQFGDSARLRFTNGAGMQVSLEIPCVRS